MKTLHLPIIALVFIIAFTTTHYASAQYGCPPISGGWDPKIVSSNNTLYVIWNYYYDCGQRLLLLRSSDDGGNTFGDSVTVADASKAGSEPVISVSGNNVYLAWVQYAAHPQNILFRMSTDDGKSFEDTVTVSQNKTIQSQVYKILAYGNNIGIIWTGYPVGGHGSSVFLSKSSDGGRSFGQPVVLGNSTDDSFYPQAVQVDDKAYIVWSSFGNCDQSRQACISQSYFTTFDIANDFSPSQIASLGDLGWRLAVSGNDVYVIGLTGSVKYPNAGPKEIDLVRSTNGGIYFEKPVTIVSYQSQGDGINGMSLDLSQNHVYITWVAWHGQQIGADILMRASNDSGTTFGNTQVLDSGDHHLNGPEPPDFDLNTLAEGNSYYATWQSNTGLDPIGQGIFLRKSTDGGKTLDNATDLTGKIVISNPGYVLVSDGNNLYIAGPDYAFKDGNHIVFSKSNDGGITFSNQIDLDQNSMSSVPEFPLAIPVLIIGITSLIVFYKIKTRVRPP